MVDFRGRHIPIEKRFEKMSLNEILNYGLELKKNLGTEFDAESLMAYVAVLEHMTIKFTEEVEKLSSVLLGVRSWLDTYEILTEGTMVTNNLKGSGSSPKGGH